ncbi:MAG: hypothetical protein RLZZ241_1660 [Bacteroidota bacterium]|jgi:1-deoxy-D-xylulose-5-phosphate synthase
MRLLQKINTPADLKKLSEQQLPAVAQELRECIIEVLSAKEGHLGASLGVVELTIALHYCYDTPNDVLVWDVGHQAYGHKILTGRREAFSGLRQKDGISGFPKRSESPYDNFGTGHASTSISAVLGMSLANQLMGKTQLRHIAVIGDASIASGMAFEALNHAGVAGADLLVILNDNEIGIDPSVGALKQYLTQVKSGKPNKENLFEALNFSYVGPVDGHDLHTLIRVIRELKDKPGPKLLHVVTTKGKGLKKAEEQQITYHAPGKFNKFTGDLIPAVQQSNAGPKYQDIFGHTLVALAQENPKIIGITAAMPTGTSMKLLMEVFPERTFDVGIAEQHAVTLAAGMAAAGLHPFVAIYSTFLQRAYDQIIHDVALQNLPVIFCLDRAGLVGQDGPTHHGIFDISYLRCIPNLSIMSPMDGSELRQMLYTAQHHLSGPVCIRYPRGFSHTADWEKPFQIINWGKSRCLKQGSRTAVLTFGPVGLNIMALLPELNTPDHFAHFDFRFAKPLDRDALQSISKRYQHVITIEDGCIQGGFGSAILEVLTEFNYLGTIHRLGVGDHFPDHGTVEELYREEGLDGASLLNTLNRINNET